MNNYIYITKHSKQKLINQLQECKSSLTYNTLIFKKKYPKIQIELQLIFINDVSDIIMTYINDIMNLQYLIIIENNAPILFLDSDNIHIGLQDYNFKYLLIFDKQQLSGIIPNKYNNICKHLSINKFADWRHYYDKIKNNYLRCSIITLINKFMENTYKKINYFNNISYNTCNVNDNDYNIHNNNIIIAQMKIVNKRKMRNMIVIIKILIDLIKNILQKN